MTFERLTGGYREIASRARRNGVRIIGATLTPFAGALPRTPLKATYYDAQKGALRERIND